MRTKSVKCLVYLEGIKIDFNSISISETKGQAPRATINFPADQKVLKVLPKTICHIFWLDDGQIDLADDDPTKNVDFAAGDANGDYRLIFQGELSGTSMVYAPGQREIALQFVGFMQNWESNCVIPYDIEIPNILQQGVNVVRFPKDYQSTGPGESKPIVLNNTTNSTPLVELTKKIRETKKLQDAIKAVVQSFYINHLYLNKISKANKIDSQIHAFESEAISKIALQQTIVKYITNNLARLDGSSTISQLLNTFLSMIGYEYCELAAPAYLKSSVGTLATAGIKRIFIKPKTGLFAPVLCNTIFDDDVVNMNFQRDINAEPTRMIMANKPSFLSSLDNFQQFLITTLVPHNVVVAKQINDEKSLKKLGLTEEEQCRGISLSTALDNTGLEEAYIHIALNEAYPDKDLKTEEDKLKKMSEDKSVMYGGAKKVSDKVIKLLATNTDGDIGKLQYYHVNIANIHYLEQRYVPRAAMLTTTYNPYRLVGFPGVIITKYFATLVGQLESSNVTISADGTSAQSLTFTHIRTYNVEAKPTEQQAKDVKPSAEYAWMDDLFIDPPDWYKDFSKDYNTFYEQVTGFKNKSIYSFDVDKDGKANKDKPNLKNAIERLKAAYEDALILNNTNAFLTKITRRSIPNLQMILPENILKDYRVLLSETIGWADADKFTEQLFVKQRADRVKELFNIKD